MLPRRMYSLPAHGGGKLLDLVASGAKHEKLRKEATSLPQLRLNQRHLCDIELILNGAFTPLDGFMEKADYESVCENMRLKNGVLFPMPITLDITEEQVLHFFFFIVVTSFFSRFCRETNYLLL